MENNHNPFDFEQINHDKKFPLFTKLVAIAIVIMFILIPLAEISPETFLDPATATIYQSCGCLVPCN